MLHSVETVRSQRERMGMTQLELAELLGVSPEYVSMLETGKRRLTDDVREKLTIAFSEFQKKKFAEMQEALTTWQLSGEPLRDVKVFIGDQEVGPNTPSTTEASSKEPYRRRKPRLGPDVEKISVDQQTGIDVVIPMLESSIPAGYKVPIYEDISTSFNVTSYYKDCFTMRVRGDSMNGSGIEDGDRVVIKRGHRFRNGDVIAAVVDGEVTLKAVWTKDSRVYLVPANPKYPVFEVPESSEFQSLGVCIDTFRPPKKVEWREK